jgi:hypothetical protein
MMWMLQTDEQERGRDHGFAARKASGVLDRLRGVPPLSNEAVKDKVGAGRARSLPTRSDADCVIYRRVACRCLGNRQ